MNTKNFVIEKLAWYLDKDLRHDPKVKLKTLTLFLQKNKLTTRQLLSESEDISVHFEITKDDVTELGLSFLKSGYQKWVKAVDRGSDPTNETILVREFKKMTDSNKV